MSTNSAIIQAQAMTAQSAAADARGVLPSSYHVGKCEKIDHRANQKYGRDENDPIDSIACAVQLYIVPESRGVKEKKRDPRDIESAPKPTARADGNSREPCSDAHLDFKV